MAIYETRARSTHYTRTRSWHPRQRRGTSSPTSDATLRPTSERVRHYSHALQWSRQKRKNLGLVRSCPTTSKKKGNPRAGRPALLSSFSCGYTSLTLPCHLDSSSNSESTNMPKRNREMTKKKKSRHDPFRWIAVTIPRESHPTFDNRKFLKKGSPLQRFPPLLPTTSIGSMHSVLWVSQVFFPSSSQETSICSSRKNRANHRDQKKKKKEPKVKKRDSQLLFYSFDSHALWRDCFVWRSWVDVQWHRTRSGDDGNGANTAFTFTHCPFVWKREKGGARHSKSRRRKRGESSTGGRPQNTLLKLQPDPLRKSWLDLKGAIKVCTTPP